jgi:long-subunit fatty acid transport protein
MRRTLLPVLTFTLIASPSTAQSQNRLRFELRWGAAIATSKLADASLGTGFGFEGTVGYRIQPHLSVYAGWDWHGFTADASFAGADNDFEETGYALGLQLQRPLGSEDLALELRAGGTLNHIEIENTAGDMVADSKHGLGWEAGAGLAWQLGNRWQLAPGLRFRSLARDFTIGAVTTPARLQYLLIDVGFSRTF